ncbi:hypothetical protein CEJ63_26800, partial [Acinetobacter baumannii]
MPPPIPAPSNPASSWWCRHWRWAMPLAVLLFLAALGGAIAWSVLRWTEAAHDSAPMREAMRRAGCSVELVQVFGEPLQAGTLPLGSMQTAINGE